MVKWRTVSRHHDDRPNYVRIHGFQGIRDPTSHGETAGWDAGLIGQNGQRLIADENQARLEPRCQAAPSQIAAIKSPGRWRASATSVAARYSRIIRKSVRSCVYERWNRRSANPGRASNTTSLVEGAEAGAGGALAEQRDDAARDKQSHNDRGARERSCRRFPLRVGMAFLRIKPVAAFRHGLPTPAR